MDSQALSNMLYNAINHTAAKEIIFVNIDAHHDKQVRVSIINPGPPIPGGEAGKQYQRSQRQGGRKKETGIRVLN